ncbi:MAG TPA: hypothetical protein VMV31_15265 [Terriglobales bacterium]|nr:hypothetical protein [Terriglobales bacterium]
MTALADDEFLARFEAGNLDGAAFHHRDHVRMAFLYLSRYPVWEAIPRFCAALRRFAAAQGKPTLYHETITWAFLLLIHERRALVGAGPSAPAARVPLVLAPTWGPRGPKPALRVAGAAQDWEVFAAANPDLTDWPHSALGKYYHPATLASALAKSTFLLPDKLSP